MPTKRGPNGVVNQARVAYGAPAKHFWRIAVLPQPRDLRTIHCRHHFSDIIGWLVTIHVRSSLESGRACTYDNYAIWSTEYGIWIVEFGIQYKQSNVKSGTWNIQYGARREDREVWRAWGFCSMKNGVRIEEYGMEYGGRRMKHGVQSLASGVWSAA